MNKPRKKRRPDRPCKGCGKPVKQSTHNGRRSDWHAPCWLASMKRQMRRVGSRYVVISQ